MRVMRSSSRLRRLLPRSCSRLLPASSWRRSWVCASSLASSALSDRGALAQRLAVIAPALEHGVDSLAACLVRADLRLGALRPGLRGDHQAVGLDDLPCSSCSAGCTRSAQQLLQLSQRARFGIAQVDLQSAGLAFEACSKFTLRFARSGAAPRPAALRSRQALVGGLPVGQHAQGLLECLLDAAVRLPAVCDQPGRRRSPLHALCRRRLFGEHGVGCRWIRAKERLLGKGATDAW